MTSASRQIVTVDHHLLGVTKRDYPESTNYFGRLMLLEDDQIIIMTCKADGPVALSVEVASAFPGPDDSEIDVRFDWTPRFDRLWLRGGIEDAQRISAPNGWLPGQRYRTVLRGYKRGRWDAIDREHNEYYRLILVPTNTSEPPELVQTDQPTT